MPPNEEERRGDHRGEPHISNDPSGDQTDLVNHHDTSPNANHAAGHGDDECPPGVHALDWSIYEGGLMPPDDPKAAAIRHKVELYRKARAMSEPPPGVDPLKWTIYRGGGAAAHELGDKDIAAIERGIDPPPRPAHRPADAEWARAKCLQGIETLARAQDGQTEGGRAHNLWPRASKAYQIAMGGGVDLQYVTDRFTDAAYRCGMDRDVDNGGMRNVETQLRRALAKAEINGPLPPPSPGDDLCGTAFQFDPEEGSSVQPEDSGQRKGLRIDTVRGSEVRTRTARYVWAHGDKGRIQRGTLALFGGRPGSGKSTCSRWVAARFTRGEMPGCWEGEPQNVAYVGSEESLEYTLTPGLDAAGADMSRVYFPMLRDDEGQSTRLMSARDEQLLGDWLIDNDIRVLIVDPVMSTISGKVDINRNNEVRAFIEPWARIAERIDGVVIGVAHLNKAPTGDVVAGINGSSAFGEVARSVFGFAKDPDSEDGLRVMSQAKNSTGPEDLSLAYRIDTVTVTNDDMGRSEVAKFVLLGDSDRNVGDVLAGIADSVDGDTVIWLRDYLIVNGRTASKVVKNDGRSAGHSADAVKRAARKLRVAVQREGFPSESYWDLPAPPLHSEQKASYTHPSAPSAPTGGCQNSNNTNYAGQAHSVHSEHSEQVWGTRSAQCSEWLADPEEPVGHRANGSQQREES
jgi:hypothetical protein